MRFLLTSNGLTNPSIEQALEDLVGKPRKDTRIAFIPTAAFNRGSDTESVDWLANDLYRIKEFCGFIDVVSLSDLTKKEVLERLGHADVIFVGGGNPFYLSYCMENIGLFDELPHLLETRVYAGISAGTMITTQSIRTASQAIKNPDKFIDEEYGELGPEGRSAGRSAKLVDFVVRPHYGRKSFPNIRADYLEQIVKDVDVPLYAIDDNSALKVVDGKVEVISEGKWKLFQPN